MDDTKLPAMILQEQPDGTWSETTKENLTAKPWFSVAGEGNITDFKASSPSRSSSLCSAISHLLTVSPAFSYQHMCAPAVAALQARLLHPDGYS